MTLFPPHITALAEQVLAAARARKMMLTTAESCTGGLIAASLTEIPGSSDVIDRGFITYSYESKTDLLGVDPDMLVDCGAVSEEVAADMADGLLDVSPVDIALAVTGIAGPGGGTPEKPVGLVYIGIATRDGAVRTVKNNFSGDRSSVRLQTVEKALKELLAEIKAA